VTFKCNFLPDDDTQGFQTSGLLKDYEDGTLRNFELLFRTRARRRPLSAAYVGEHQPPGPPSRRPWNSTSPCASAPACDSWS